MGVTRQALALIKVDGIWPFVVIRGKEKAQEAIFSIFYFSKLPQQQKLLPSLYILAGKEKNYPTHPTNSRTSRVSLAQGFDYKLPGRASARSLSEDLFLYFYHALVLV